MTPSDLPVDVGLTALAPLLGTWDVRIDHPEIPEPVGGVLRVEPALSGAFLREVSVLEDPVFPASEALLGPGARPRSYLEHYADSRGVHRTLVVTLEGGVLTRLREEDPAFWQRFRGHFSADGSSLVGAWEKSADLGRTWQHDFAIEHRRR